MRQLVFLINCLFLQPFGFFFGYIFYIIINHYFLLSFHGFEIYVQCVDNCEFPLDFLQLRPKANIDFFGQFLNLYISLNLEILNIVYDSFAFDSLVDPNHEAIFFILDFLVIPTLMLQFFHLNLLFIPILKLSFLYLMLVRGLTLSFFIKELISNLASLKLMEKGWII